MVHKKRPDINDIFVQALYLNDHTLLKTILEGMKYTRVNRLQALMGAKEELGGFTPLEFVCLHGNSELASILIDTGVVELNRTGQYKWTALHVAAFSDDLDTVQMLINSCADCFAKDDDKNLPLDLTHDTQVKKLLMKTMLQKNLESFKDILNEIETRNNIETSDDLMKKEKNQRSKSCIANVSLLKLSELKSQLTNRKNSNRMDDELCMSNNIRNTLRKWKTYSDLTLQDVFHLTC